jgi:small subunit ribosomal protein S17
MATEERTHRKVYSGVVVSDKMNKSIVVEIPVLHNHKMYGKHIKGRKKFVAHDENNEAHVGDTVKIMETRPLSATKRFRLVGIVKKAVVL